MGWKGDPNAIHQVVDGEIAGLTEKATPVDADLVVIEDSADSNSKKKAQLGNLPRNSLTTKGDLHGYDTGDARIPVGSDDQVLTADSTAALGVKWATPSSGGGGGGTVPEWVEYLAVRQADETAHADDDFFDDGAKTGWSEHTVAGTATWTESRDRMNVKAVGGASLDSAVNLQSIGATGPPYTIESAIVGQSWGVDFFQTGICFTDGLTDTSNVVWVGALARANGANLFTLGRGTLTSIANATSDTAGTVASGMHEMWQYFRLVNTAANTWAANVSPNGVDWWDLGFAPVSFTMTPTHYGLFVAQYQSATTPLIASYEYFRVYESNLDV